MNPERLKQIEAIYHAALETDTKVRAAYLDEQCGDDNDLRSEVESLLEFEDSGLGALIHGYTRESGVRNLEREVGNVCRKVVRSVVMSMPTEVVEEEVKPKKAKGRKKAEVVEAVVEPAIETAPVEFKKVNVTDTNISEYLGPEKFRDSVWDKKNEIGSTTGLAWTEVGGTILTTEVSILEGRGKLTTTGKLGDVMQESIAAAMSVVRSRAKSLGISEDFHEKKDIHVHVPEGATPKDGPSAGIAICTAIVSVLTGIPVRAAVAMTGEITLRGEVLPIGGLKEKLLAAHRGGIKLVMIPEENVKDLAEIPENIKNNLDIQAVRWVDQVLQTALERLPEPAVDAVAAVPPLPAATGDEQPASLVVKH